MNIQKRTFKQINKNGRNYNFLALPNTEYFKFEIVNLMGSNIEKVYENRHNKNVYGMSHLVEHLSFRSPKDYTSEELLEKLKSEGTYNASTDHDRINYWFKTTTDRTKLAINLITNVALNNLSKISDEEFQIEKKVVYNEAKRYADDDQTMFYFNIIPSLSGYNKEDNIIGTPETIDTFTLEDCINIKDIFLQNSEVFYNITYDPNFNTEDELIEMIEDELNKFEILKFEPKCSIQEYKKYIKYPESTHVMLDNESEQSMHAIVFDSIFNELTADAGNDYLLQYSKTSLNDVIREKHGLTYSIGLSTQDIDDKAFTVFGTDISSGDEELLMYLLKESISDSVKNFNEEAYNEYMKIKKLKRKMSLMNLESYNNWHYLAVRHPNVVHRVKHIIEKDLDKGYIAFDNLYCSFDKIDEYLKRMKYLLESGNTGYCTNIKN